MTNSLLFAAAAPGGGGLSEIATTFGLNWQMFVSQLLAFIIVALVLKRFAYGPIVRMLEERRRRIAEGLENAEKIKAELAKTEEARQEVLKGANERASKLIEEARASAAKVLEQETQKAIATANQIIEKAKTANEAELVRMKGELRKEVGRLVIETTAKVTGKILTMDDQQRLVAETNKELAA